MTKDQIKNKMQKCSEMAADIASSLHEDTLDDEIDLEAYSKQYENAED